MTTPHLPSAIEHIATDALIPYARNSRTHSPEQVADLARSIEQFGFTNPVLIDEHNTLIAGHGRVMAAQRIGLALVPAIRLLHLNDAQRRAYVIADNQLALQAGWDMATLAREVEDLTADGYDIDLLGFGADELSGLLGNDAPPPEPAAPSPGTVYREKYAVLVDCKDEADQQRIFEKLTAGGMSCKVLVN